jgi:preprotein translocase subunit SecE
MAKSNEPSQPKDGSGSNFNPLEFARESQAELSKIVWPSRQQLVSESISVILMVTLSATIIYLVNNIFSWAASQVFPS